MWQHWHVGQEIGCGLGFYWKYMQSNHGIYIARVVLLGAPRTTMDQVSSTVFLVDLGSSINSMLFGHVGHGKCCKCTCIAIVLILHWWLTLFSFSPPNSSCRRFVPVKQRVAIPRFVECLESQRESERITKYTRSIARFENGKNVTFWNPPPPCGDLVAWFEYCIVILLKGPPVHPGVHL